MNRPPSVVTIGEAMGVFAAPTTFAERRTADVGFCGAESNVAIGLARLGVDVTWISRLGDDSLGRIVSTTLAGEGVRVSAETDAERATGLLLKEQRTPRHTIVRFHRAGSAASALSPADVEPVDLAGVRLVHLTGITPALSPSARTAAHTLLARARKAGARVSFDVNYRSRLWGPRDAAEALEPFVAAADVLFAGEDEAALFVGATASPAETAERLRKLGPGEVVIKRGVDGALSASPDGTAEAPARTVPVLDTVGAGDAFVAGYLAELLAGAPVAERLRTATTVAAFACMSASDWAGLPRRSELGLLDAVDPVSR